MQHTTLELVYAFASALAKMRPIASLDLSLDKGTYPHGKRLLACRPPKVTILATLLLTPKSERLLNSFEQLASQHKFSLAATTYHVCSVSKLVDLRFQATLSPREL